MPYKNFTAYPLWQEASALTDSIFDFSRQIEDFSLRNRMTGAAVEIPFRLGEAAQSESEKDMKSLLWRVEDPVNELRSVLTESKEQGFAPDADYELMQERCRTLFQKVHTEASAQVLEEELDEVEEEILEDQEAIAEVAEAAISESAEEPDSFLGEGDTFEEPAAAKKKEEPIPKKAERTSSKPSDDDDFDNNAVI